MKRRTFIAGLGSAVALPVVAWAQQADQLLRERSHPIGVIAAPNEGPSGRCGHRSNPSPQALE